MARRTPKAWLGWVWLVRVLLLRRWLVRARLLRWRVVRGPWAGRLQSRLVRLWSFSPVL